MNELMEILSPILGDELAAAIIEYRKRTIKKPLTAYAAKLQAKEYIKTGNPQAAAEMQMLRTWQAIRADWYFNEVEKEKRNAKPILAPVRQSANYGNAEPAVAPEPKDEAMIQRIRKLKEEALKGMRVPS